MAKILQLACISDFYGNQLKPGGPIGICQLGFNCTYWQANDATGSIIIRDGETLLIKRNGFNISVEREVIKRKRFWQNVLEQ